MAAEYGARRKQSVLAILICYSTVLGHGMLSEAEAGCMWQQMERSTRVATGPLRPNFRFGICWQLRSSLAGSIWPITLHHSSASLLSTL